MSFLIEYLMCSSVIISVGYRVKSLRGTQFRQRAIEKAKKQYEIYRANELKQLESDFDKATKKLREK